MVSWCRQAPENVNILAFGYTVLSLFVCLSSMACYIWSLAGKMRAGHVLSLARKCTDDQAICIPTLFQHKCTFLTLSPSHAHECPHILTFHSVKTGALSFIISVTVAIATLSTASASSPRAASGPHL